MSWKYAVEDDADNEEKACLAGLENSHLVTFSLCSFLPSSFVINFLLRFLFPFFLLFFAIFGLPCAFPAQTSLLNMYLS